VMLKSGIVRGHMFRLGLSFGNWLCEVEFRYCEMYWFRLGLSFGNWLCEVEIWYCEMYWFWIRIVFWELVVTS
jgi:hypothetical protein